MAGSSASGVSIVLYLALLEAAPSAVGNIEIFKFGVSDLFSK